MNKPALITMHGPKRNNARGFDLSKMSNFEAGIATLILIDEVYPGAKFKDLPAIAARYHGEALSGWWTDFKSSVGDVKDGIGDVLKSTFSTVGGGAGDALRLATDEKVVSGATKWGTAYASGGASGIADEIFNFMASLGSSAKAAVPDGAAEATKNVLPWALAGGGALLLVLIAKK